MTADPQDRRELAERLLPCPFCGSPAKRAPSNDTDPDASPPFIGCGLCDVWFDDAASWNRRQQGEGREPDGWVLLTDAGRPVTVDNTTLWGGRERAERAATPDLRLVPVYFGAAPTLEPTAWDLRTAQTCDQGHACRCELAGGQIVMSGACCVHGDRECSPTPEPEHPRDEARRRGPLPPEWFGGLGDKTD